MGGSLPHFELFHYWRSSTSWRVRAAFAFKGMSFQPHPIGLLNEDTDQPEYRKINPVGAVPVLKVTTERDSVHLIESLAIIQYLEQIQPVPSLCPQDPIERARVFALCEIVNSGIHPIQNLPVLHYLSGDPAAQKKWAQHWIALGLGYYETLLAQYSDQYSGAAKFSYGDSLTMADLCLIPQVYNALRYEVDMTAFPRVQSIYQHCLTLPTFTESHPDQFKPID